MAPRDFKTPSTAVPQWARSLSADFLQQRVVPAMVPIRQLYLNPTIQGAEDPCHIRNLPRSAELIRREIDRRLRKHRSIELARPLASYRVQACVSLEVRQRQ